MATRIRVFFAVVCLLFPGLCSAADHITHVIRKGENVSKIVLKLTGSNNYRKDGIVVAIVVNGKDTGRVVPKGNLDVVHPGWEVRIKTELAKTEPVTGSAGKTLAQVCDGSSDPRCAQKLALLNGIITSRTPKLIAARRLSKPLSDDVYALPGTVIAVAAKAPVSVPSPVVAKTEPAQEALEPAAAASAAVSIPDPRASVPPPLPLPPSSSSSPSYWRPIISALAVIGIFFLAVVSFKHRRQQQRLVDLRAKMEDMARKFELAFKKRLPRHGHQVTMEPLFDIPRPRFKLLITPTKGDYPNLSDHAENLKDDLSEIRQELVSEPFSIGEAFQTQEGVCVQFTHRGGEL